MRVIGLGGVSVCVLGLAACSGNGNGSTHNFTTARDRWESKAPAAYAFTLHWDGAWTSPQQMRVTVEDGRVTSPSPGPSPCRFGGDAGTIDQMFHCLARDIGTADEVKVAYDETWGFPT